MFLTTCISPVGRTRKQKEQANSKLPAVSKHVKGCCRYSTVHASFFNPRQMSDLLELILTVSFFLLKTGIATDVISSRLWALVVKSWKTGKHLVHRVYLVFHRPDTVYKVTSIKLFTCCNCEAIILICVHFTLQKRSFLIFLLWTLGSFTVKCAKCEYENMSFGTFQRLWPKSCSEYIPHCLRKFINIWLKRWLSLTSTILYHKATSCLPLWCWEAVRAMEGEARRIVRWSRDTRRKEEADDDEDDTDDNLCTT